MADTCDKNSAPANVKEKKSLLGTLFLPLNGLSSIILEMIVIGKIVKVVHIFIQ